MTAQEVADAVEAFFEKYNHGEKSGHGDDNVGKWEMWGRDHWERHVAER